MFNGEAPKPLSQQQQQQQQQQQVSAAMSEVSGSNQQQQQQLHPQLQHLQQQLQQQRLQQQQRSNNMSILDASSFVTKAKQQQQQQQTQQQPIYHQQQQPLNNYDWQYSQQQLNWGQQQQHYTDARCVSISQQQPQYQPQQQHQHQQQQQQLFASCFDTPTEQEQQQQQQQPSTIVFPENLLCDNKFMVELCAAVAAPQKQQQQHIPLCLDKALREATDALSKANASLEVLAVRITTADLAAEEADCQEIDLQQFVADVLQVTLKKKQEEEEAVKALVVQHLELLRNLDHKQATEKTTQEDIVSAQFAQLCLEVRNARCNAQKKTST